MEQEPNQKSGGILSVAIIIYFTIASVIFIPYYNWEYATTHGFVKWIFLGEIVATGKAFAWPYFVFYSPVGDTASHEALVEALAHRKEAIRLINNTEVVVSQSDMDAILDNLGKSLAAAKKADCKVLNKDYPALGDHFEREFIRSIELYVSGYENRDPSSMIEAERLHDSWVDWFNANLQGLRNM